MSIFVHTYKNLIFAQQVMSPVVYKSICLIYPVLQINKIRLKETEQLLPDDTIRMFELRLKVTTLRLVLFPLQ